MTDSLKIWGTDYTGVKGFKAKDSSNNQYAYLRPQGTKSITQNGTGIDVAEYATVDVSVSGGGGDTDFIFTVSYNSVSEEWEPDCTWSDISDAYAANKTIAAIVGNSVPAYSEGHKIFINLTPDGLNALTEVFISIEYDQDDTEWNTIGQGYGGFLWTSSGISYPWSYIIYYRSSSDITMSGATVSFPSGMYDQTTVTISSGTEGTPTATKGTVSNHSVSVTPSVTNSAGYISGGTHTGTAVTVTASELESGTKSISANGTNIDVTGYAAIDVAVPSSSPNLQAKTNISPLTSSQTIQPDSGYDGLSSVQINAMPSGSVETPNTTIEPYVSINVISSTGVITATASGSALVFPRVTTPGYVVSGSYGTITVDGYGTTSLTTRAAQTIHPSASDQTIARYQYLTGAQTIKAITTSNLTAENIKSGVTVEIGDSTDSDCVASVTGTYTGGSSKNIQVYSGYASRTANSYGATNVTLTVAKAGTYKITWMAWRGSSSGTMGTNLHIGSTAEATNHTTWTGTYGQCITLNNQNLTKDQVLTLYATSGSNSRTVYVGNLIIEEQ